MLSAAEKPVAVRPERPGAATPARTVVLVEDDIGMRLALKRVLVIAGFNVEAFVSAEECLAEGAALNADCLVCDLHLPGASGFELSRHLTQVGSDVPVIFITAHDTEAVRGEAKRIGARGYLAKPFEGRVLVGVVSEAMRARPAQ
jgi:FixJ family two-component response regulator